MELPKAKTPPKSDLTAFTIALYGPTKIGKTTFCSRFDNALFLACEPGLNALEAFQVPVSSWPELLEAAAEIAKGGHDFRTVVIDTADNAYKYCEDYVCAQNNIKHSSDLDYGKGSALVNNEFRRVLTKLANLPYGLILVSHSKEKELKTPTGKAIKTCPTLPNGAYNIIVGMSDMVLYADNVEVPGEGENTVVRRMLHTRQNPCWEAGDRTGRLPEMLPFSYAEFYKAFTAAADKAKK